MELGGSRLGLRKDYTFERVGLLPNRNLELRATSETRPDPPFHNISNMLNPQRARSCCVSLDKLTRIPTRLCK